MACSLVFQKAGRKTREGAPLCRVCCYIAPSVILRETALATYQLNTRFCGMDYTYLAEGRNSWQADGEVQIFSDYRQRLNDAALARRETVPLIDNVSPELARAAVQRECETVRRRRKDNLKKIKAPRSNAPVVATEAAN
jgi:hypothetical protein